ncbi:MAG TPA: hypothetical protein VF406_13940 [Thermodesulfobacteriota bacterium]
MTASRGARAAPWLALAAALWVASLVPLFSVRLPPLFDYPNHLARLHILAVGDRSDVLGEFYTIEWHLVPNLAMDLLVPPAARLIGVESAGRLFIAATFLLLVSGTMGLHAVLHRRLSPWPLLAFLLLYNKMLTWGLVGYLFGVGLFLWTLAAWVATAGRSARVRLAVFSGLATVLLVCHLYALGLYGVSVLAYELSRWWRARRRGAPYPASDLAVAAGQFVLPAALFLALSPMAADVTAFQFRPYWKKLAAAVSVLELYDVRLEVAVVALAGIAYLVLTARGVVRVSADMVAPLGGLVASYLAMPATVFGSNLADRRLPVALAFLLVAATDVAWRSGRSRLAFAAAVTAVVALQLGLVQRQWRGFARTYATYFRAIEALPVGAKLMMVYARDGWTDVMTPPVQNVWCMAVIERSAFVPFLFARPSQQPLALTPRYRALAQATPDSLYLRDALEALPPGDEGPFRRDLLARYDFLAVDRERAFPRPPSWEYRRVFEEGDVTLYRLH